MFIDPPHPAGPCCEERIQRHTRLLRELADMGMRMARATAERAEAEVDEEKRGDREKETDGLVLDVYGRLEDLDDTAFLDAPLGEILSRICRTLGADPDLTFLRDIDWEPEPDPPPISSPPGEVETGADRDYPQTLCTHPPPNPRSPLTGEYARSGS